MVRSTLPLEELHLDRREVERKNARLAGVEETKVRLSVAHTAEGEQQAE